MQSEFKFDIPVLPPLKDGVTAWRAQRREEMLALARRLGLPIGAEAEVWLRGGIRLRGLLELDEEMLLHSLETDKNARFAIDRTVFAYSEMESCIRL